MTVLQLILSLCKINLQNTIPYYYMLRSGCLSFYLSPILLATLGLCTTFHAAVRSDPISNPGAAVSLFISFNYFAVTKCSELATFNNHLKFSPLKELLREKECQVVCDSWVNVHSLELTSYEPPWFFSLAERLT